MIIVGVIESLAESTERVVKVFTVALSGQLVGLNVNPRIGQRV